MQLLLNHVKKINILNKTFNLSILLLVSIVVLSFIIRWKDIETVPYGIENDELEWIATSLFHENNILASEKGVWSLYDTLAFNYPVSTKLISLSFKIFGTDFLSARKILSFSHVISLIFFYFLARKFLSKNTSLLVTLLYSLSTYNLISGKIVVSGGGFSELFIYPSLILLLSIDPKKIIQSYLYSLLSGILMLVSFLNYSLVFLFPIVCIVTIFFICRVKKSTIGRAIVLSIFFLLPLLVFNQKLGKNISGDAINKSYALVNATFDFKDKKIYMNRFMRNIDTARNNLFNSLQYSTSDMVVSFPGPLVNKWISVGFLLGLVLALFNLKKYFTIVVWLLISSFTYNIVIGLLYPRWWIFTVSVIYLFSGVVIDKVCEVTLQKKQSLLFIWIAILSLSSYIIYRDLSYYYKYAINNSAYLGAHRELVDITKKWKNEIGKKVLVIIPDSSPTNTNTAYTIVSFNYLSSNPNQVVYLKNANRTTLGVLKDQEFIENNKIYLVTEKILIVDNRVVPEIKDFIKKNQRCDSATQTNKYFSEISLSCKNN